MKLHITIYVESCHGSIDDIPGSKNRHNKGDESMKRFNIQLELETYEKLRKLAYRQNKSISQVIREMLEIQLISTVRRGIGQ